MRLNEVWASVAPFVPVIVTLAALWVAARLLHERPGEFLKELLREILSLFERRLTRRGINLIGGIIMLLVTLLAFAEGLFDTVLRVTGGEHSSAELQFYSEALRYALIFFCGIYFLISLALSHGEP